MCCVRVADTVDLVRLCQQSSALARQSTCDTECILADAEQTCNTAYIPGVSKTSIWLGCVWGICQLLAQINSAHLVACMATVMICTLRLCSSITVFKRHVKNHLRTLWDYCNPLSIPCTLVTELSEIHYYASPAFLVVSLFFFSVWQFVCVCLSVY